MAEEGEVKAVAVVVTAIKCTVQAAVWLRIKATAPLHTAKLPGIISRPA